MGNEREATTERICKSWLGPITASAPKTGISMGKVKWYRSKESAQEINVEKEMTLTEHFEGARRITPSLTSRLQTDIQYDKSTETRKLRQGMSCHARPDVLCPYNAYASMRHAYQKSEHVHVDVYPCVSYGRQ